MAVRRAVFLDFLLNQKWLLCRSCQSQELFFSSEFKITKNTVDPGTKLGPDQYGIFGADADIDIREEENADIRYIYQLIPHVLQFKSGQSNRCDKDMYRGRMSNKLCSKHRCTEQ